MSEQAKHSIYFKSLLLENIRSFGEQQAIVLTTKDDRPAPWTLLVGDNGVGKTTILQCLARMRPVFNIASDEDEEPRPKPIEPELARESNNDFFGALARSDGDAKANLEAHFSVGAPLTGTGSQERTISTSIKFSHLQGKLAQLDAGGSGADKDYEFLMRVDEPLVLAYGAGRHPKAANADAAATLDPIDSLFEVEAELHDAEILLSQLDHAVLRKQPGALKKLSTLKNMLSEILPDIEHPDDIEVLGPAVQGTPPDQAGIRVKTSDGRIPFGQLGLGCQTVFSWTTDIAWRLIEQFPDSPDPLREPAIVIVDEIDLHLHPHWQRQIRRHLTRHFPRIQFIATAHSPLMAQSSLDTNLAVLRRIGDHTEIVNDPVIVADWRLDQVITSDLFGFKSARRLELEEKQMRRRELVEKEYLSASEQQELAGLNQMILELPTAESPEDQKAMDIIRHAAKHLEKNIFHDSRK